ncbi:SAM-dependent methyltransferase [Pseudonocardia eucalypti]|uniref:SAM-dependent methyltransferase n=1 Tax=Pseudonocardia eucalypti TaxID=648755 RepID=A0ABP9QH40_9PSEU
MADLSFGPKHVPAEKIRFDVPHRGRIWSYWLGGKDHYPVDRAAGEAVAEIYPDIRRIALESRRFLERVVRYATVEAGIRQFLDLGNGLPATSNTHDVAQRFAPDARIAYVDGDPLVQAHQRALLVNTTPRGMTAYVDAEYFEPDLIISGAREVLDFDRPILAMFMGVLGYVADFADQRAIVSRVMEAAAPGSYAVLWGVTNTSEAARRGEELLAQTGALRYHLRSPEQLASCFDGMRMLEPGMVPLTQWRPDLAEAGLEPAPMDAYGALALKP